MAARVDEDQRGAMLAHELGEPVVDLCPHLARHDRFERRRRHLEREIAPPRVTGIDDAAIPRRPPAGLRQPRPRRAPTRKRATSSIGFCVADNPIAYQRGRTSACSRSSDSARCAPRLLPAIA